MGYFSSNCNLDTVYVDGKISNIRLISERGRVKINNNTSQKIKHLRIETIPRKWVLGKFVGSTAKNSNVTNDNFKVNFIFTIILSRK